MKRYIREASKQKNGFNRPLRKTKSVVLKEKMDKIEECLKIEDETLLGVRTTFIENKGRGIKV